jgi:hypothetical protein
MTIDIHDFDSDGRSAHFEGSDLHLRHTNRVTNSTLVIEPEYLQRFLEWVQKNSNVEGGQSGLIRC